MTEALSPPMNEDIPELWPSSGFRLLERDPDGCLAVTDSFIGA